jgi:hypothetical protein
MNKRLILPVALIAFAGLMAGFASSAQAYPTKTSACTGCHDGVNVPVTATLLSTVGTNATYSFSAPGADAVVVFDGATKIFTFTAASGQFTVATGKTYTLYSVAGPSTSDGLGSTTVSPVGAPVDATAPVTTSDAKTTYVSAAAIKLTATDAGSGVAATYYRLDGGLQLTGTSINVTALGAHTIEFWSTDVAGNIELHKTAAFTITAPVPVDATAPVTTSDAKTTYVSAAAIKLTATDAMSGVAGTYYKLDGGAQVSGTAINVTALGAHTIEFWSTDVAGNVEAHKTASFTITAPVPVDATAPVTISDAKATYVSAAAIKLTATDAGSGVAGTYYKLDGGAQVSGTSINVTALGAHTIEFWSTDVAGNVEAHKTASFTITAPVPVDATAPVTTSDALATYVASAAIKLSATDAMSGVAGTYYKLDGGAQVAGTAINVTALGAHTIEFWSTDVAGNVEAHKTASFTITAPPAPVDATAPVTISDAKATYVSAAAIKLAATDAGSGVAGTYYKLDGGAQVSGTAISVTATGTHTIEFWSTDVAGNIEAAKTASFTITAPTPVPTSTVVYTVTTRVDSDSRGRTATLTNTVTGAKFTAVVGRRGYVTFTKVPAGTYRLSVRYSSTRTIRVPLSVTRSSDDDD